MKRALFLFAPLLLAGTCSAPTDGTSAAGSDQLVAFLCTVDGDPLGMGYAVAGSSIWSCTASAYEIGCDCSEPAITRTVSLALPPGTAYQAEIAIECWAAATPNLDPATYTVERGCSFVGYYQPGNATPQSIDEEGGPA